MVTRDAAGLVVGGGLLAVTALSYDGCDRFGGEPYAYVGAAIVAAAVTGALAETESGERIQAGIFAAVLVALAGVILLGFLFGADDCSGL